MSDPQECRPSSAPNYRVFMISQSGRVESPPTPIEAQDDEDALPKAQALVDGHVIELWDRSRLVIRLLPKAQ